MTNSRQKVTIVFLLAIFIGLLVYNISNPYVEKADADSTPLTQSVNEVSSTSEVISTIEESENASSEDNISNGAPESEPSISQQEAWLEQYRGNSLKNGAQPYHELYGYNSNKGNSKIEIKASSSSDVLVMIKNQKGNVVKHIYIRKGQSASVTLNAGTYQTYFIYCDSWCPEIKAPNGALGYFLENVSISKDYPQNIPANRILQYTLYQVNDGNFSPIDSNSSEAF